MVLITIYSLVIILWLYYIWCRRFFYKIYFQMPGPWGLPLIGVGLNLFRPEQFLQYLERISKKYKAPFISWLGSKCVLYVNDPETCETIFNSPHCVNKAQCYDFLRHAIGDGLFTSKVPRWNKHRRLLNSSFKRSAINDLLPIFNHQADLFVETLRMQQDPEGKMQSFDLYELLKQNILQTSCITTMGHSEKLSNGVSSFIFEAFNGITEICVTRILRPWLYPDVIYHLSKLYQKEKKYTSSLQGLIEKLLRNQLSSSPLTPASQYKINDDNSNGITILETEKSNENVEGTTNSKYLGFIQQMNSFIERQLMSWQDVRDEANVIVAATFETTSTALYFVCLCLAMHPKYQERLYTELIHIFTNNTDSDSDITVEQLKRLEYTEMVINEAMRLFAPVPVVLREATAPIQLNNGCIVPAGTQIAIDIYNMQRNPDVWGSLAKEFHPDIHFSREPSSPLSSYAFIPFTKGLRMCIGYRYAMALMKIMLAKIFYNFQLQTSMRLHEIQVKGMISLKLQKYPMFKISPHEGAKTNEI